MRYLFVVCTAVLLFAAGSVKAQQPKTPDQGAELDSLRKLEERSRDTVIFNSKYIRYTTLSLLSDSTQTVPIDTSLNRFQMYNVLIQPERPTVNLGNLGLPYQEMLFSPSKSIGFDAGFHSMDIYLLTEDSIKYFRARTPYTSLYYAGDYSGGGPEQVFRVVHSQNIKHNWNVGADYYRIGAPGIYRNQKSDHLNAALFTWYESPKKRYNLLANARFNTLKADENGALVNDTIFTAPSTLGTTEEAVKLNNTSDPTKQIWKQNGFFIKQFYYIGRIDSLVKDSASRILPTQRISHSLSYTSDLYRFYKDDADPYNVFPDISGDQTVVIDSTSVKNIRNELMYSFYLRGRSVKFIKNELKLDVGLQHDFYKYEQMGERTSFQNITFKGNLGYRFSNRVSVNGNLQQIIQGKNAGDFLYDAKFRFLLSRSVGRIILGAYSQNKSPERIYEHLNYTYQNWDIAGGFDKTKVNNLSFAYENPKFRFNARADYYLITNYLYFEGSTFPNEIVPRQEGGNISMLKVSVNKKFVFGRFNLESFAVYQKTDNESIIRTPEIYTFNSFYYSNKYFKGALRGDLGFDVRFNTSFTAPSYDINTSQFYNGYDVKYSSYPIGDVWGRFALRRANIFVRYNYVNQGLFSKGYYTVNRYPMPNSLVRIGLVWNFYD